MELKLYHCLSLPRELYCKNIQNHNCTAFVKVKSIPSYNSQGYERPRNQTKSLNPTQASREREQTEKGRLYVHGCNPCPRLKRAGGKMRV